ncbi:hypothetical protein IID10_18690 [candidate division KSB1 bacterium]|nr:hypothetical protein [candidate division KSB1 bacterium]TDJ00549.1 MAG: hypothetical protein E2O76_04880 [Caldithrix sp.]
MTIVVANPDFFTSFPCSEWERPAASIGAAEFHIKLQFPGGSLGEDKKFHESIAFGLFTYTHRIPPLQVMESFA